jgi:hypothetical protein
MGRFLFLFVFFMICLATGSLMSGEFTEILLFITFHVAGDSSEVTTRSP